MRIRHRKAALCQSYPPSGVSSSPRPSPTSRTQVEEECSQAVAAAVKISDLALKAENGVTLRAAVVGSGQRGVILLRQKDNGMSGWLPYAGYLTASYGGAVAIGTCAAVQAGACVALSPALYDNKLGGGMTAPRAIGQLRVPLLIAAAPDDSESPAEVNRALMRRARPGSSPSSSCLVGGKNR